jgi:MoxR-like ATPase
VFPCQLNDYVQLRRLIGVLTLAYSDESFADDVESTRSAIARSCAGLVDRELIAEVTVLCAVAREHLLVVGAPGTAKSEAVRRVATELGGNYFEYLLGRFTEPNEIFGPVDLRRLKDGIVEIETAGMLPEAHFAFLDEVFLGSTAILNTLLGILNERRFRRGATALTCPLRVCVGASNSLPEDPNLAAFADRFLARLFVEPVADARLDELLEAASPTRANTPGSSTDLLPALDRLSAAADAVDLSTARQWIASGIRRMRGSGIPISDRRAVRVQRLVAAAAVLDGRRVATAADLWVLPLVAPTQDTHDLARDSLAGLLEEASNATTFYAAEEFSRGRSARAQRLTDTARSLLADAAAGIPDAQLRVESTLREIDSCFAHSELPADLAQMRQLLIQALPSSA